MLVFNLYGSEKTVKKRIMYIRKTVATITKNFTENYKKTLRFMESTGKCPEFYPFLLISVVTFI